MFSVKDIKLKPTTVLRLGLALTLIYAGLHAFTDPTAWLGFIPAWVAGVIAPNVFLSLHAGLEIVLGLLLIFKRLVPFASFLIFLDFLAILVFYGIDTVTFRDFGLLTAALALFLLTVPRAGEEK